ncbi:transient receptor potential cation channel subfamily V member 1-like [Hyla sarda]|uniref:transient receptor potential cation channel subfamily V member 1-like n=1 Tax=Hyla sarda TaxID=327740 RepID=UPI0024C2A38B|nr:transient receptor potential cation channel subfamily V member 1-like [Hyla sarda]XP_056415172.1 transient receptor potential cation channel subfamily V member 1-like [Hyla sarda]XP_056415173.1 transient receptor potential cation channel subfamily V member 1-like [Hyla sarda]
MSNSDSEDDGTPRRRFSLEVHDKDSIAAFGKEDKDGKREAKPPMDSALQKESDNIPPTIGFNFDFLGPAQVNGGKAPDIDPKDCYNRERIFAAVANEDTEDLAGLQSYLQKTMKKLTNSEFTDPDTGKTCLLKAMWNLRNGRNDTIPILLEAAKNTGHLEQLVNAGYTNAYYHGQTALHIAIERRNLPLVKLLMENKADVHASADGLFFQPKKKGVSFYFGELPLSLAACTNQLNIVSYLLNNPHRRADLTAKDTHGNTVLHALVLVADNTEENTEIITKMYDDILKMSVQIDPQMRLEDQTNIDGLTPMKLAAKLGKLELLKHIIRREIEEPEYRYLSRKFTEWTYGPVITSLYDISSVDTHEPDSVLENIVFKSKAYNRHKMIVLEPLNHLLQEKWDSFAGKIFYVKFILYIVYMSIFTATAYHRPLEGQPPFPLQGTVKDNARVAGEVFIMLGGIYIFICQIIYFWKRRPSLQILMMDGYFEILFFLQAILLLFSGIIYLAGNEVYVAFMVFSLVIGWVDILYYTRGFQQTGIYSVMIQKTILRDMLRFLLVYIVFLFGFAAALVTLIGEAPEKVENSTETSEKEAANSYSGLYITSLELFKFTIGMGDLEFNENLKFKHFFMFLLILYVVLTYVLLLNMLIALMSETVNKVSSESKNIWKLQRAATILDIERFLPRSIRKKLRCGRCLTVGKTPDGKIDERWCFRVEEMQWGSFGKNQVSLNEEPGDKEKALRSIYKQPKGWSHWVTRAQERAHEEEQVPLNSVSTSPSDKV